MINKPLISVIVPVYDVEDCLRECIDSIVMQTYDHLEIILVDDGSPDQCPMICDAYAEKDSRVVVLHKKNGGLSDARNAGLDSCKGEYIAFVDSDDKVHPRFIEILYKNLINNTADISFCSRTYDDFEVGNLESSCFDFNHFYRVFSKKEDKIVVWNKLYKAEVWKDIRFEVGRFHEDEFIFHHLYHNKNFCYVPAKLYYYRKREGSIMATPSEKRILDTREALARRYHFFRLHNPRFEDLAFKDLGIQNLVFFYGSKDQNSRMFLRNNLFKILRFKVCNFQELIYLMYSLYVKK